MKGGWILIGAVAAAGCGAQPIQPQTPEVCTLGQSYTGAPRSDVPAASWSEGLSESIDGSLSPDLVAALEGELDSLLARYPAASVAVAIPGEGMWTGAGDGSRTAGIPVSPSTPFRAASITKPFVSAIALQLVEEGRLGLDDFVDRWFPEVPRADLTTIEHLLTHTSGLLSFNALPGEDPGASSGYRTPDDLIALASSYPPSFCPGTRWSYTNTGYILLGRILEEVTGRSLSELIEARISAPLGLASVALPTPGAPPIAVPLGFEGGQPADNPEDGYLTPWAAGGLVATSADLVRFWHAFLSGRVVPDSAVRSAFTGMYPMGAQFPAPPRTRLYYGRGVQFTDAPGGAEGPGPLLEHSGGIRGFNAIVAWAADDGVFISVMANDRQVPAAAGLWRLLQVVRRHRGP